MKDAIVASILSIATDITNPGDRSSQVQYRGVELMMEVHQQSATNYKLTMFGQNKVKIGARVALTLLYGKREKFKAVKH